MLLQFHANQKMIENFWGEHGQKNVCVQSGDWTLKLTLSEKWTDGTFKLIFACWYMITKIKKFVKKFLGRACSKVDLVSLVTGLKNEQIE